MEICNNGTLKDHIQSKGNPRVNIGKLSTSEAIDLFRKIIIGYSSVVESLFIHRDLKAANILLRGNG
jgi:serine/threonine protein kinase